MESGIPLVVVPAILIPASVALLCKAAIYCYAHFSTVRNEQTRMYLWFLFSLSLQNVAEIFGLYNLNVNNEFSYFAATLFYFTSIFVIALLFQLAITLAFDRIEGRLRLGLIVVHLYACVLAVLLVFTPWLIPDYQILDYGFGLTGTRVAGPLYFLFEIFAIGVLSAALFALIRGAIKQDTAQKRIKNQIVLAAIVPMVVVVPVILTLLHFGIKLINASVIFPICMTYFLIVTAYATYQYRIFDIQFFIPWSKVRKRKAAFYQRLRALIAEFADVSSVNQAINLLADALRCPVALISGPRPVLAISGNSARMVNFPLKDLRRVDNIVVANEIAEAAPALHTMMRQHGVAAIVPFYPHSETAASWMLLGDSFSDQVYTPLDFKMVEQVFDRLGDLFLDKLLFMRSQLHEAREQLQTLQLRLDVAEERNRELQRQMRDMLQATERPRPAAGKRVKSGKPAPVVTLVPKPAPEAGEQPLDTMVANFESRAIEQALERCGGNRAEAARLLGLRPNTLHYKIERYGLANKPKREPPED